MNDEQLSAAERMDVSSVSCYVPVCDHGSDTERYRFGDAVIAVRLDGLLSHRSIYEVSKDSDVNLWAHNCECVYVRLCSDSVRDWLDTRWLVLLSCGVVFLSAVQVATTMYQVPDVVTLVLTLCGVVCCVIGFHLSLKSQWSRWYGLTYDRWHEIVRDMCAYMDETHDKKKTFRYVRGQVAREHMRVHK